MKQPFERKLRKNLISLLLDAGPSFSSPPGVHLLHASNKGRRLSGLEKIEIIQLHKSNSTSVANDDMPRLTWPDLYNGAHD